MQRGSGILLHITSLPSAYGIGDLGPEAYEFVDFLHQAKQKYWQILPLNPTDAINYHSPYSCLSAFAGNFLLLSPDFLVEEGWLKKEDVKKVPEFSLRKVEYDEIFAYKKKLYIQDQVHYKQTRTKINIEVHNRKQILLHKKK